MSCAVCTFRTGRGSMCNLQSWLTRLSQHSSCSDCVAPLHFLHDAGGRLLSAARLHGRSRGHQGHVLVRVCVCACVYVCVRVRACVRALARVWVRGCVSGGERGRWRVYLCLYLLMCALIRSNSSKQLC
jgi:hypothetical protein